MADLESHGDALDQKHSLASLANESNKSSKSSKSNNNNEDDDELPTEDLSSPPVTMDITFSPIPKSAGHQHHQQQQNKAGWRETSGLADAASVKNIASRFENKKEQSLDALPFRTVRNFFDGGDERSIYVKDEKQKYDALMEKQRQEAQEALLRNSPELKAARVRTASSESATRELFPSFELAASGSNNEEEEEASDYKKKTTGSGESALLSPNDTAEEQEQSNQEEEQEQTAPPAEEAPLPPPPADDAAAESADLSQLMNTPEQETKKRPILTTERSFVMEEDHTIETEDMIVVGERFSSEGEEDREELMKMLERELRMTADDEEQIRDALESNPSRSRRGSMLKPTQKYKKPENVPSKLFVPTAASLASRTTKKEVPAKTTPKPVAVVSTPTPTKNRYANVKSKVKQMLDAAPSPSTTRPTTTGGSRRGSDASDASFTLASPASSTKSSASHNGTTKSRLTTKTSAAAATTGSGSASVDRRSFMSNSSRRSSNGRSFGFDLHGEDGHADWEGRHRNERLSFASSTSSTDSSDPMALQLAYTKRKSRYDNVEARYLDYSSSSTYTRNKESQLERRKKLEQANAAKSADRQKQINFHLSVKEKKEKEDQEAAARRHADASSVREMQATKTAVRRALNSTAIERPRRHTTASSAVSSPRSSLLSEPDSIPSTSTGTGKDSMFLDEEDKETFAV